MRDYRSPGEVGTGGAPLERFEPNLDQMLALSPPWEVVLPARERKDHADGDTGRDAGSFGSWF